MKEWTSHQLLDGTTRIRDWRPSANDYDWLGHGIYFWEHAPARALQWSGRYQTVLGAVIQLGRCLDLTDVRYTALLGETYQDLLELYQSEGRATSSKSGTRSQAAQARLSCGQRVHGKNRPREHRSQWADDPLSDDTLSFRGRRGGVSRFNAKNRNPYSDCSARPRMYSRCLQTESRERRCVVNEWELLARSRDILKKDRQRPANERMQELVNKGTVDEKGHVKLWWDAFLAVVAVKRNGSRIDYFRCLQPALGMPGMAEIDVRRDSLVHYIADENKRVITAYLDKARNRWIEGADVRLFEIGGNRFLRTAPDDVAEDNLGDLPELRTVRSGL